MSGPYTWPECGTCDQRVEPVKFCDKCGNCEECCWDADGE